MRVRFLFPLLFFVALSATAKPKRFPASIDVASVKNGDTASDIIGVLAVGIPLGADPKAFATLTVDQDKWLVELDGSSESPRLKPGHYDVEIDEQHKYVWINTHKADPRNRGKELIVRWDVSIIEKK